MLRPASRPWPSAAATPALLLAVCLSSGLGGCTGASPAAEPASRPPPPRTRPLAVADLELRALLLLLVDRQTYEAFAVERALQGDAALRAELATALGRVGDPRGLSVLEELAADPAVAVRRSAVFALGRLAEPAATGALARAVADPDRLTGQLALEALGRMGLELAAAVAAGAALSPEELEARLLPGLWRFSGSGVVRRGERGLQRDEPELRRRAAFALCRNPRPEATPTVRRLLQDPDPVIRAWAARALGRLGEAGDLELLLPLLADPRPGPRIRALAAAGRLVAAGVAAPAAAWRAALLAALEASHRGVRLAAIEAASGWLLDEALGDRLVALARAGEPAERRAALLALAGGDEPRAGREVLAAAASETAGDRAAAAAAAGALGDLETARRLLADREPRVRQAALAVLLAVESERAAAQDAGLADPDPGVRAATAERLAESPTLPVMELLRSLAGEAQVEELPELPLLTIRAIVARVERRPDELEAAVFALERFAAGGSYLVRRAAADGLARLGRTRPPVGSVDSGRRVADYEAILRRTRESREIELITRHGALRLRLACREAPLNCLNLVQLVELGFYDGLTFHRVVPDFVVQGGDPRGDGWGGPGYTVRDEIGPATFAAGTLGMALGGADTGGSQFFITLSPQPHLDGSFTAFGRVVDGWAVLERITAGDRILSAAVVGSR